MVQLVISYKKRHLMNRRKFITSTIAVTASLGLSSTHFLQYRQLYMAMQPFRKPFQFSSQPNHHCFRSAQIFYQINSKLLPTCLMRLQSLRLRKNRLKNHCKMPLKKVARSRKKEHFDAPNFNYLSGNLFERLSVAFD